MLKCNLGKKLSPDFALTTHPNVVRVVAELVAKLDANCIIFDCPENYRVNFNNLYEETGMLNASNDGYAELNNNFQVFNLGCEGMMTKNLTLADALNDVDLIINIPKLIVDKDFGLKGATDNLFGLIPGEMQTILRNKLFKLKDYSNYLIDIYNNVKDKLVLNVVDAVVARESNDSQRIMNAIVVGDNPFTVDYLLNILTGNKKEECLIYELAKKQNLVEDSEIEIIGERQEKFIKEDFSTPFIDIGGEKSSLTIRQQNSLYNKYVNRPVVDASKCKGCQVCIKTCPVKAIKDCRDKNNEIYAKIDKNKCINCFRCVKACPYKVINTITPPANKILSSRLSKRTKLY